jgi:hypothetical protein
LGQVFEPLYFDDWTWGPTWLCYQRMYSPRHAARRPLDWGRVDHGRPLRCVELRPPGTIDDRPERVAWLARMNERYELRESATLRFETRDEGERIALPTAEIRIYEFVPRRPADDALDARANSRACIPR